MSSGKNKGYGKYERILSDIYKTRFLGRISWEQPVALNEGITKYAVGVKDGMEEKAWPPFRTDTLP